MSFVYYFPALFLIPDLHGHSCGFGDFALTKRRWQTSTFDLATLATRHKLHLPYQLIDVLLSQCNCEIVVTNCDSLEQAKEKFNAIRLALYVCGISPFIAPYGSTHSINDYSGINSRDSESLRSKMPPEMQGGFTSADGTIEIWPVEASLQCLVLCEKIKVDDSSFKNAAEIAPKWLAMAASNDVLYSIQDVANASPQLISPAQSVLHIWCALESLFPNVRQELSFRLALYLAHLNSTGAKRRSYFEQVKKAYALRSNIAHGSKRSIGIDEWAKAWTILMDAVRAILQKGDLLTEDALLASILS